MKWVSESVYDSANTTSPGVTFTRREIKLPARHNNVQ